MAVVGKSVACMEGWMNSRRPKIWQTEDEILAAIDRTRRLAKKRLQQSQALDEAAKLKFGKCEELRFQLMKPHTEFEREQLEGRLYSAELSAVATKEKADVAARAYHRATFKTLPRLGEILSAFRTGTFSEVLGEYKAVSVR